MHCKLHKSHKPTVCVTGFENMEKKLSRKRESKSNTCQSITINWATSSNGRIRRLMATYTTLSTLTSQVYHTTLWAAHAASNKKAQLSLTNPRDAKAMHAKIAPIRACLQRCRWQYWSIFIRLAVVASEICEIQRNSPKIQTYRVQGHPRSSILVSIEAHMQLAYA